MTAAAPRLSVILPADRYETIRTVIEHLRAQTASEQLELVVVTSALPEFGLPDSIEEDFAAITFVEIDNLRSMPRARAKGIRAARAPIVVLGETHSYPDPGWAAALIEAHRGPWTVVGPTLSNANPDSMISWSSFFMDYGPWIDSEARRETHELPGHNSSFKREALLAYGDDLEYMTESDTVLIGDLRHRGYRLYMESRARTVHLNVTHPTAWITERFSAGWLFAALRAREWSLPRRGVYVLGAPLIPAIRLRRLLPQMRRAGHASLFPRVLPALLAGLFLMSAGELCGYAFGMGPTRRLYEFELHRSRYAS